MKTIGLIGGMSWESTVSYYQTINTRVKEQLGGLHSAKCALYSVDFQEIEACQKEGRWDDSAKILAEAARSVERAGADFALICTNTMHKVFDQVQAAVSIPLLHIAEATAGVVLKQGLERIGLLGTAYTMEQDFYKAKLQQAGIEVIIPEADERREISRVIYEELCLGIIRKESRDYYVRVVESLSGRGAQGVIMGCTEIGLLLSPEYTDVPLFDTAEIHASSAAQRAMETR